MPDNHLKTVNTLEVCVSAKFSNPNQPKPFFKPNQNQPIPFAKTKPKPKLTQTIFQTKPKPKPTQTIC